MLSNTYNICYLIPQEQNTPLNKYRSFSAIKIELLSSIYIFCSTLVTISYVHFTQSKYVGLITGLNTLIILNGTSIFAREFNLSHYKQCALLKPWIVFSIIMDLAIKFVEFR